MNFSARTVLVILAAAAIGFAAAVAGRAAKPDRVTVAVPKYEPPQRDGGREALRRPVGTAGCMAAACHGAPADQALRGEGGADGWQSSGSCWTAADPHAAAYKVLEGDLARRIMDRYDRGPGEPAKKATDHARCLACHTNPALADVPATPENVALREQGVSCEACHGNAGGWLQPHTAWHGDRTTLYKATGMTPLFDLGERALACAGCHVGAPAEKDGAGNVVAPVRDMNHDMIAAGHPRLDFDFAEFQRRLPRHWQEKDRVGVTSSGRPRDLKPGERNEAQVWYIGRVAHAEAACRLLEDRAGRSQDPGERRTPWPEFAESNCASCHHHLRVAAAFDPKKPNDPDRDWRKSEAALAGRPPGVPPWQTVWPLTHAAGIAAPARGAAPLSAVVLAMEQRNANAAAAIKVAGPGAAQMRAKRVALVQLPAAGVEAEARGLLGAGGPMLPEWDSATQLLYGLAALEYAKGQPRPATVAKYRAAADAFRGRRPATAARDWDAVEAAFRAIR